VQYILDDFVNKVALHDLVSSEENSAQFFYQLLEKRNKTTMAN
jgi:hypothetical protein